MKRTLMTVSLMFVLIAAAGSAPVGETAPAKKANYDLAAQWMSAKAAKLVFDTSVSARWLESDRFWYSYESGQGRKYYLVDPVLKTKKRCSTTPRWRRC